jgi:mannose-6-phosphate isomerase-like protein (cupin superfamily)
MDVTSLSTSAPFASDDGSVIRELFGPATIPARNQSVAEATIPIGEATRRHHHRDAEEIYVVVAGAGRMELDGDERDLVAGDAVLIPPGAWHQIRSTGEEPLRLLVTCSPAYRRDDVFFA